MTEEDLNREELMRLRRNNEKLRLALAWMLSCLTVTTQGKRTKRYRVDESRIDHFARIVRNANKVLEDVKR